jgi:hypothetical protein
VFVLGLRDWMQRDCDRVVSKAPRRVILVLQPSISYEIIWTFDVLSWRLFSWSLAVAVQSPFFAPTQRSSRAASSNAMPARCPISGFIAWQASPNSTTRPERQSGDPLQGAAIS